MSMYKCTDYLIYFFIFTTCNNYAWSSDWMKIFFLLSDHIDPPNCVNYWTYNGNTHGQKMFDIGVKQGCPLSPTLFGLYIDELETNLDKVNGDSWCLFNTVIAIILYANDVVLLSKSRASLQRLSNKLHGFCTSSDLVRLFKCCTVLKQHTMSTEKTLRLKLN
jgi:uncharacterized protein YpbB